MRTTARTAPTALAAAVVGVVVAAGVLHGGTAHAASAVGSASAASAVGSALTWAPPALVAPTTVPVTAGTPTLRLDPTRDYVVRLPGAPVVLADGLTITGGHSVVLIGGEITTQGRGLYLKGQTGTVHVEGLRLSSADPGHGATEGIDLDERLGATVQLEDVAVETVTGSYATNHADVLQTWAGPGVLRVDRLEGSTTYQGLFLDPGKFGDQPMPSSVDLRTTVLRCAGSSCGYLLWQSGTFGIATSGVVAVPGADASHLTRTVGGQASWAGVVRGDAATPSPLLGRPGVGYTSPGYAQPSPPGPAGPSTTRTALLGDVALTRLGGSDRYATAAAISADSYPTGSPQAVVASGADFADALAAGQLAAALGAPLLLVPPAGPLPAALTDELTRLRTTSVTVVGGAAAVPDAVLGALGGVGAVAGVTRVSGADRYATAAAAAAAARAGSPGSSTGSRPGGTVLLASGATYPDAVAGGALTTGDRTSLLLSSPDALPAATAAALVAAAPARVVLLGGTASLSAAVAGAVAAVVPGAVVQRWAGDDRYATAAAVSADAFATGARTVVLVAGTSFPDALAGGPAAGRAGAPVLLVQPTCVPAATLTALARLKPSSLVVLGASAAVSSRASELTPC